MLTEKIKKFIRDPKNNYKKIIPYINAKIEPYRRDVVEALGSKYYSQPYDDMETLLKTINFRNGFFIEIGGNDGYFHSPTYYLEKFMNWKGILIEPLPVYKMCKRNRKKSYVYNYACVGPDYKESEIKIIDCNAMSVVKGGVENYEEWVKLGEAAQSITAKEISVKCLTLNKIIEENFKAHGVRLIDLFVIDVEGYEVEVLKGLDFSIYTPRYILIEMHTSERQQKIENEIFKGNYKMIGKVSHSDYLYMYIH